MDQVAKDFDLTETAVLERVTQAGRDTETRSDGGLTSTERQELTELRRGTAGCARTGEILKRAAAFFASRRPGEHLPIIETEKETGLASALAAC
jgi:transposase-like protein